MFYLLYRTVGPEDFRRIAGGFYQTHAVNGGSADDFVTYAQSVAGPDLAPLFQDWMYTTGWWNRVREARDVEDLIAQYVGTRPAS
jgi:aminopeptidase N